MGSVLQWVSRPTNLEEDLENWIREQQFSEPNISVEEELRYFRLLDYISEEEFHQGESDQEASDREEHNPSEPEREPEVTLDHQTIRENILRRAQIAREYRVIENWTRFTSSLWESRRAARVIHTWLQFRHS